MEQLEEVFFIDGNGKKVSSDEIKSHIGLANLILENDEELKKEFEQTGKIDPTDFLVIDKGYMKISELKIYRCLIYASSKLSEKQKRLVYYYLEEGYRLENLDREQSIQNYR